jgi:hypothetical protein
LGGAGVFSYRLHKNWELVGEVGGCKTLGLGTDLSGDSLTYLAGPRWSANNGRRWTPHSHLLIGGHKVTEERLFPEKRQQLLAISAQPDFRVLRPQFTETSQANGLAMALGAGMDVGLTRVVALRLADFQYQHTWLGGAKWAAYRHGVRFSTGIVFRVAAW